MLIWCKSARHGRALLRLSNNRKVNTRHTDIVCHVNQYIWQEIPELRCLVKLNLITYLCTYAYLLHMVIMRRPVPSGCFFENIHDNQILSTWSTGQHVANLKFQNRFLDSYSILLLLLIGLPWRLLKHMHSQLYTLEEVSPWCDIADVFDARLNWFAWSKRNSDTLHELLILYTQKQDTSTQIFFSKNTFHYNRVVHTMCMWR